MSWDWYGVKTLYRTTRVGTSAIKDDCCSDEADLIEERVVLMRARSFEEAIKKAEKEAEKYTKDSEFINLYGQQVCTKYIGSCDAFQMFNEPGNNKEVYSQTFLVNNGTTDDSVCDMRLGKEYPNEKNIRKVFLNEIFAVALDEL